MQSVVKPGFYFVREQDQVFVMMLELASAGLIVLYFGLMASLFAFGYRRIFRESWTKVTIYFVSIAICFVLIVSLVIGDYSSYSTSV
jgi:hypothetical protein